ncbi:hypothetical protein V6N13_129982 [Hibiscus sabdariffa]
MVTDQVDWDWDRLREVLPDEVLEHLAATPPPLHHLGEDVPGWRWDDKREFTVKSAYSVLVQEGGRGRMTQWNRIWSIQVPQRVKVFMWITAHQRHLTNVERVRRHMASSGKSLWRSVLGPVAAGSLDLLSFDDWLHGNISGRLAEVGGRKDWAMEFSIFCWLLWKLRCSMVLDSGFVECESVLDRGRRFMLDCRTAFAATLRAPPTTAVSVQRWEGPQSGWVKCNVDATGSMLVAPPGRVASLVAADQQRWEEGRVVAD